MIGRPLDMYISFITLVKSFVFTNLIKYFFNLNKLNTYPISGCPVQADIAAPET